MTDILNARHVSDLFGHIPPERERGWVPTEYVDEVSPPNRASPDAWIVRLADGAFALAGPEDGDDPGAILRDGETVLFDWQEDHGDGEIKQRTGDDGKPELYADPPMPADATHVWLPFDYDSISNSVANLVKNTPAEIGDRVEYYACSNPSVPFIFRAGQFHAVEGSTDG